MRKILLSGATGHLGRHVLKQLGPAGFLVRALVRTDRQTSELLGFAQEVAKGDLTVDSTLRGCCDGIDTIISTAGASVHLNTRGSASFRNIDFAGNRNLLEEARRAGVRKFVYVSVLNSPGLDATAYVRAKEDFATLVAQSGLEFQILRPTGFFSAFADLVGMARKRALPIFGAGAARTNPIDDEEVAAACIEAIDAAETHREIGGPQVLTRKELTDLVFAALARPARYQRVPAGVVNVMGKAVRVFNPRVGDLIEFYLAVSKYDAVAPAYGTQRISDYFSALARYS